MCIRDRTTAPPKGELTEPQTAIIDKQKPMVALTFDDGPHYTCLLYTSDELAKTKGKEEQTVSVIEFLNDDISN